jgi:predicted dehydrogenase
MGAKQLGAYTAQKHREMDMKQISRRTFVKGAGAGAAGAIVGSALGTRVAQAADTAVAGANDRIRVAVLGIRGRGGDNIRGFLNQDNVEVATLCDIDENLFEDRLAAFDQANLKRPKIETDLRRVMDDESIDVVSIATPNHWHALAAIWACQAGKDVYVEKPCSHNIFEGRKLVEAAQKYKRIVQHGTQIRSHEAIREAMDLLRDGVIGEVYMARGLCYRWRDSIGIEEDCPVPLGVDYDLWLGPAPNRPFNPNRFHYNWHYHWDYGNGDIGNQGVHQMDIARWGLGVGLPARVTSMAGMYLFDDQKEVPNVITTAFDYPDAGAKGRMLVFDTRPWITNDEKGAKVGVLFYGADGYLVIDSYDHYKVYLGPNEEPGPERKAGGDHYRNFIQAVRARDASMLTAPPEEGHLSSALCHMGLLSAKLKRSLEFDPATERFVGDDEANRHLGRDYRAPFVVPETV